MSSFSFIMEALEYEIKRQKEIQDEGGLIDQETRLFDEEKGITLAMRSKEDAPDYRYFPDPDLLDVKIDSDFIKKVETKTGIPVVLIGTGPEALDIIDRRV